MLEYYICKLLNSTLNILYTVSSVKFDKPFFFILSVLLKIDVSIFLVKQIYY